MGPSLLRIHRTLTPSVPLPHAGLEGVPGQLYNGKRAQQSPGVCLRTLRTTEGHKDRGSVRILGQEEWEGGLT